MVIPNSTCQNNRPKFIVETIPISIRIISKNPAPPDTMNETNRMKFHKLTCRAFFIKPPLVKYVCSNVSS